MKASNKNKPVKTIPKGVWESSRPESKPEPSNTTDLQGNGYPVSKKDTNNKYTR